MNRILGYFSISLFNWIMVSAYGYEALHPTMDLGFQQVLASYYFGLGDDKKKVDESWFPGRWPFTGQQLFKLNLPRKHFSGDSHYEKGYLQLQVKDKGWSPGLMAECYSVDAPYGQKKSWLFDSHFAVFSQNLDVWILDFNFDGEASLVRSVPDNEESDGADSDSDCSLEMICDREDCSYLIECESLSDNDRETPESHHYISETESSSSSDDSSSSGAVTAHSGNTVESRNRPMSVSSDTSLTPRKQVKKRSSTISENSASLSTGSTYSFCSDCSTCCSSNPDDLAIEDDEVEGLDDVFVLNGEGQNSPPDLVPQNYPVDENREAPGEQIGPPYLIDRDGEEVSLPPKLVPQNYPVDENREVPGEQIQPPDLSGRDGVEVSLPPYLEPQNYHVDENREAPGEQIQPPDLLDRDGVEVSTVRSSEPIENRGNVNRKNIFDLAGEWMSEAQK